MVITATIRRGYTAGLIFCAALFVPWLTTAAATDDFVQQRQQMVKQQLQARDIDNTRILRALSVVPRHRFVPKALQHMAYADTPLPIGHGQTISQPYIVAFMSQTLDIQPGERILEIGTGSGYQAAVLAELGASVYSIEIVTDLGRQAAIILGSLGYDNVHLKIGDGYQGWPEHAPFDAIVVTCAPARVPDPLQNQLAEGGRMIIPVGERNFQQLVLLSKKEGKIKKETVLDVRFVPMVDDRGKTY